MVMRLTEWNVVSAGEWLVLACPFIGCFTDWSILCILVDDP